MKTGDVFVALIGCAGCCHRWTEEHIEGQVWKSDECERCDTKKSGPVIKKADKGVGLVWDEKPCQISDGS